MASITLEQLGAGAASSMREKSKFRRRGRASKKMATCFFSLSLTFEHRAERAALAFLSFSARVPLLLGSLFCLSSTFRSTMPFKTSISRHQS